MRHRLPRGGLLLLIGLAAWGCSNNSKSPTAPGGSTDQTEVQTLLDSDYGLVDDSTNVSEAQEFALRRAGVTGMLAAIHPLKFWRTVSSATRSFTFTFSDSDTTGRPTKALVTVQWLIVGTFNIIHGTASDSTSPDTVNVIHKPYVAHWVRYVGFQRVPVLGARHWRFSGVSLAHVAPTTHITQIDSVRVQATGVDTTISDPSALFRLRQVVRIAPSDSIRITVSTGASDDVVLLHLAGHRHRLNVLGGGHYTIRWVAGPFSGWRHFGVDAIAHASVYDDAAEYDADRWTIPFVITGQPVVDYYP